MRKVAVVFPGQGSQFPGMLDAWKSFDPYVDELIVQASDTLGYDMDALIKENDGDKLNQTQYTQPAILLASFAIWSVLNSKTHCHVELMAGHSLGEYTALLCAGALSFEQALQLVSKRGQYMQECVQGVEGGMVAIIGLEDAAVEIICSEMQTQQLLVSPANYNAIGQVVVAGDAHALNDLMDRAVAAGAKIAKKLSVSVPSHCMMMTDAVDQLKQALEEITLSTPTVPVLSNVDLEPHRNPTQTREKLCQQLIAPVQWVKTIQALASEGVTDHIEIGPGRVLTGLCKRINQSLNLHTLDEPASIDALITLMEEDS